MKLGTENRNKLIISVVLMALALVLVGRWVFDSPDTAAAPAPTAAPAAVQVAPPPGVRTRGTAKKVSPASHSLDPSLRYDWLKASEDTPYEGNGRNIFKAEAEIPKPVVNPVTDQAKKPQGPPLPPPPPPINLKFFGFASQPGEPKRIFLSQGEDVFIAGEGEIVDRRYRILHISPMSVEVEDVLNNNKQSIPLTQG